MPQVPRRVATVIPVEGPPAFAAFTLPCQLRPGKDAVVVVIKATCDLLPDGPARIRDEADPPSGDLHVGEETGSLLYPSDFATFKPRADVTLVGHAHAPGGSSPAAQVGFSFGRGTNRFSRRIAVFGAREWKVGGSPPKSFDKVPLVYERAFGGEGHAENPVGVGRRGNALPQLEDPDRLVSSPSDSPSPACFCGIPMKWPTRWSLLGTYDAAWVEKRWPNFPDDFDWGFFQAAPRRQQLAHLDGDEPFELVGMHASHPRIRGALPGVRPRCFVQKTTEGGAGFHEVAVRLDTVTFDVDAMKITLVWRGSLEVRDDEASEVHELFLVRADDKAPALDLHGARAAYEETRAGKAAAAEAERPPPARPRKVDHLPYHVDPGRRRAEEALALGGSLCGLDLSGANLADLDFSGRSLERALLKDALLARCVFTGADLSGAQLGGADLTDADLGGARLVKTDLTGAELSGAKLVGAEIGGASFVRATGAGARFSSARGSGAKFTAGTFGRARFDEADLPEADFTAATLDGAVFDGAKLPAVRFYDATASGASFRAAELGGARGDGARFDGCSFDRASAKGSIWDGGSFAGSSFLGARLAEASFTKAACGRAIFSGADLASARLRRAVLRDAALMKANLFEAKLEGADLSGADLRGANLHGAEVFKAKLDGARLDLAIVTKTLLEGPR